MNRPVPVDVQLARLTSALEMAMLHLKEAQKIAEQAREAG